MIVVICVRDPDDSNSYSVYGGEVEIVDVDLGRADLRDPDEFSEWFESHLSTANELREKGETEAGDALEALIREQADYKGHKVPERVS